MNPSNLFSIFSKIRQYPYYGVIKYMVSGFMFGIFLIMLGSLINFKSGYTGHWYDESSFSRDFVVILYAPIYLSIIGGVIGIRRGQLLAACSTLQSNLLKEQILKNNADHEIKFLGKIVAQVNESIIISDRDGCVEWVNNGFSKTTGFSLEDVKGKRVDHFLHGPMTDKELAFRMIEKVKQGESASQELLTNHKDGSHVWLAISIKPIFDDKGNLTNFISIQNDITSRKEKELSIDTLFKEVANYKFALDQSAIVFSFNDEGKMLHVNRKFCEINKYTEEELLHEELRNVSWSVRNRKLVEPIWDRLKVGKIWKGEFLNRNVNGTSYWADATVVPLINSDGTFNQFLAIIHDITERKKMEAEIIKVNRRLQQAMHFAKIGSWEVEEDGTVIMSRELKQLYKLPETPDYDSSAFRKTIHPEERVRINDAMARCRTLLQEVEVEFRVTIEGQDHYMLTTINPSLNKDGEYAGSFGIVQDITSKKLAALTLRKSEEEKAVVFNNTQTIICLHDMNGVLLDMNPAAEKASGFTKNEVMGLNLKMIVTPDFQHEFETYLQTIKDNDKASGTFQIFTKRGVKRVWLYQNTVYKNENSQPYVIASAVDITESVKAQNEIERQQQFIRQIIDNSPNLIFMLNEQREVILANRTFSNYYNYSPSEKVLAESLSHGNEDIFLGDISSLFEMNDGETRRHEGSISTSDNSVLSWFNIIHKCFTDKKGRKYILGFGMDITTQHHVELDLKAANNLVEKSLKVKDQFISNMSHEIRTPLNAVIGFTDLLAETSLDKRQTEFVEIVRTASTNLLGLINNILDLSKIGSGNLILENAPIKLEKIVNSVVKILEPKVNLKGLELHAELDKNLPEFVMGDELRLSQVLLNVIGNAIKFTDVGKIDVTCKLTTGLDVRKHYIAISIQDTGVGVPKAKQQQIFERFSQANTDTQRLYGGTGLGLNITKSIVDLYDGTLKMDSEPGIGTTFHIVLPFGKCTESETAEAGKPVVNKEFDNINSSNPLHILLAEDNMVNAMLATEVLGGKGFTIHHVVNGALAVEAVQKQHFDLILMDIQMPVMNGINATRAIRQLEGPVSSIPIIAMTAHSLHGEMTNCYESGMNGYVSKPFKAADLFSSILNLVEKRTDGNGVPSLVHS